MAVDDNLKQPPVRPRSTILEMLGKPPVESERQPPSVTTPGTPAAAESDPDGPEVFDPESSDYKACGRGGNKSLPSLRLILKDKSEVGCSYGHLDTAHPGGCQFIPSVPGKGNVIKLRFAGQLSPFMVILEGTCLRRIWEAIMTHRTPWVYELPSGVNFHGRDEAVITSITLVEANGPASHRSEG